MSNEKKTSKIPFNFTPVPNLLLNDNTVSLDAKGLYAVLRQFSKGSNKVSIASRTLKDLTKKGTVALNKATAELIKCGYLRKESGKSKFNTNTFFFVDSEDAWTSFNNLEHRERYTAKVATNPKTTKIYIEEKKKYLESLLNRQTDSSSRGGLQRVINKTESQIKAAEAKLEIENKIFSVAEIWVRFYSEFELLTKSKATETSLKLQNLYLEASGKEDVVELFSICSDAPVMLDNNLLELDNEHMNFWKNMHKKFMDQKEG